VWPSSRNGPAGLFGSHVPARPIGRPGPAVAAAHSARARARRGHGHRSRSRRGGTGGHGLPVLVAGLGWWHKLEGASGRAPDKVSGGGAYPSGVPVVRRRSSGGRLHTSTPDVEVVAGRDPGEVLRLGGGYAVVRAEPIRKRRHGCGAHQGRKLRWHFGANPERVAALRRSRLMHGLCGEGRKGC
jgi:hypothetical protein